ncbi:deleted in malignant brain tumors 1 protein-like isoform X2 [Carcharodon carcharias]|uniref:deleted in malignant brain tumors 1 protein-like isoform X2 n=1 Tax=Carcharodon carcharias TaxID=13397 RepID=UPI001B7E6492|nr:deleted in malignant brain tumors 1 protein-like isoform X2 [Carcharodon carcharias]
MEPSSLTLLVLLTWIDRGLVDSRAVTGNAQYPSEGTLHPAPSLNLSAASPPPAEPATIAPPEVPVRLVNGASECSGWVELHHQGTWRPLCREFWDAKGADVICRQLGCGLSRWANYSGSGGGPGPFWVNLMNCTGSEAGWMGCPGDMLADDQPCDRNLTAGLLCTEHKELRLVGGGSRCAGRVEVNSNGTWGTVCDDSWDLRSASVVCRQLGCGSAVSSVTASHFGQGQGPIYLDEVNCSGAETYLWSCPSDPWLQHDCGHKEDAGVVCSGHREIRLTGGPNRCSGRLSVHDQGTWGSLCATIWNLSLAHGVCQYLGCGNASRLDMTYQLAGEGRWGDLCQEGATEIADCLRPLPADACEGFGAAGVVCTNSVLLTESPLNATTDWMTTAPVAIGGSRHHSDDFLYLIIGLLALLLFILCILFTVNYFRMRRRMVMHLTQPSHNSTAISSNDYREMSPTPSTNSIKPPAQSGSVRNQSERRNPQANVPMTVPEVRITTNDKGQRSDLVYRRSKHIGSSSEEEGARAASSSAGRKLSKPKSQLRKQQPSYRRPDDTSSTSSCEWYENTSDIRTEIETQMGLLVIPQQNELQSSTSTLPAEEYENVEGDNENITQAAIAVIPSPIACAVVNDPVDESTESDYDDIEAYFPS